MVYTYLTLVCVDVYASTAAGGSELINSPFPCCVLPNFIQDKDDFLDSLKDEILRLKYYEKDNDLYQFHQVRLCVCVTERQKQHEAAREPHTQKQARMRTT